MANDPYFFRHRYDRRIALYVSGVAAIIIAALLWWML
jgi:hypothetical protein